MKTIYINECHLGNDCQEWQAREVIYGLENKGWKVRYGESHWELDPDEKVELEKDIQEIMNTI